MSDAALFLPLPDDETLYAALLARDPAYDGFAFVGVKSTGVFCRLTCPARKPKRENTQFFDSIRGCVEAGFRPCLRCRPLERLGTQGPLVSDLLQRLGRQPQRR
ncbi:Ada metal-binding domain-containing protein, partial [Pseudomonas aeruginosa]|uniref:Ada metal-binding domain-containing protein n=1 Tax=Pseudomonas aeruginosa TaxID=287 RepID=UPI00106C3BEB